MEVSPYRSTWMPSGMSEGIPEIFLEEPRMYPSVGSIEKGRTCLLSWGW
jgi:hypothetical protein